MEVLELRTYRDLQYVRSMETLMRSLDARLRAADGSVSAKSFQVGSSEFSSQVKRTVGEVWGGRWLSEGRVIAVKARGPEFHGWGHVWEEMEWTRLWGPEGVLWQGLSIASEMTA